MVDPEHPDLYNGTATMRYRLSAKRVRDLFGLDDSWEPAHAEVGRNFAIGAAPVWGIEFIFNKTVPGPVRAMEILGGVQP